MARTNSMKTWPDLKLTIHARNPSNFTLLKEFNVEMDSVACTVRWESEDQL